MQLKRRLKYKSKLKVKLKRQITKLHIGLLLKVSETCNFTMHYTECHSIVTKSLFHHPHHTVQLFYFFEPLIYPLSPFIYQIIKFPLFSFFIETKFGSQRSHLDCKLTLGVENILNVVCSTWIFHYPNVSLLESIPSLFLFNIKFQVCECWLYLPFYLIIFPVEVDPYAISTLPNYLGIWSPSTSKRVNLSLLDV